MWDSGETPSIMIISRKFCKYVAIADESKRNLALRFSFKLGFHFKVVVLFMEIQHDIC